MPPAIPPLQFTFVYCKFIISIDLGDQSRTNSNMPVSTDSNRLKGFKNKGKDMEDLRRRRTDVSVELRKAKKDDQIKKKRQISEDLSIISPLKENNQQNIAVPMMDIEEIIRILTSASSDEDTFKAVQCTRRLLSREKNPPIDKVIKAGLVPSLIKLLQYKQNTQIQFEAAWAVTNIASGTSEQTKTVVEAGCVDHFRKLLTSGHLQVCEQAVWALGNIAGDGPEYRDLVIDRGCVQPLLNLVTENIQIPFLRNVTWTISNLCRNKNPPPDLNKIMDILPMLGKLITHADEEIVADTCWALSYLTDGPNEKIAVILGTGVVERLVKLLQHRNVSIVTPSLRAIGNIVTGDDTQTQHVLDHGALKPLRELFDHSKAQLVKEAAWAISNIAAGTPEQIHALIDADIIPPVIKALCEGDFKVQKEAVWVITNYTSGGSLDHILYLLHCNVLEPLCKMLDVQDTKTVMVALDGMRNILLKATHMTGPHALLVEGEPVNAVDQVTLLIEQFDGVDYLEKLQNSENDTIQKLAYELIDQYFQGEDDEEDNTIAPYTGSNGCYQFAVTKEVENKFTL